MEKKLLLGNAAIAEGALESGVEVVTGYPGTPSSELIQYLADVVIQENLGTYVEWSVNEKVALDVATAAAWAGKRSLVAMKMAGLNVASDTLINIAYKGVKGGMVVYVADDPDTHAGCTEQDSRYYALLSHLPILEPSDPMDAKRLTILAFELSEQQEIPIILRATTNVAHIMGVVEIGRHPPSNRHFAFSRNPCHYTTILADRIGQHTELIHKLDNFNNLFDEAGLNPVQLKGESGVIASGVSWTYVQEAIQNFDLNVSTLKIDSENPWPQNKVKKLINHIEKILIVEEQEPLIENMVKKTMVDMGRIIPLLGKSDDTFSRVGEYDFEKIAKALSELTGRNLCPITDLPADIEKLKSFRPKRSLTFCAGCQHAATYYIINQTVKRLGFKKDDVIITGDIGCTSLGVYKPLETLWTEVTMGASIGLAHGFMAAGATKPVIATLGDSTFFHSGIPPLINAVQHNTNLTIIVLDNSWTAMTGFQPNPNTGMNALKQPAQYIRIEKIAESLGAYITTIQPYDVERSIETVSEVILRKGVKVVISREECALQKLKSRDRKQPYTISEEACEECGRCVRMLGCPAIMMRDGKYFIDHTVCIGCGVCSFVCQIDAIERLADDNAV